MKFVLNREAVLKPANSVRNIINPKAVNELLQNMLFTITDKKLTLEGSDLEVGVRYTVDLEDAEDAGKITVPADKFVRIIADAADEHVNVLIDNNRMYVASGSAKFELLLRDAEDYPVFPEWNDGSSFTMPFHLLKEMIKRTIFATATDTARFVFRGVLFEITGNQLNLVATDSHVLARATGPLSSVNVQDDLKVVVPRKVLDELLNCDHDGNITVHFNKQNIRFDMENVVFVSRLIDAKFPEYQKVIPSINNKIAQVPKADLLNSFKRVGVFVNKESGRVTLAFDTDKLKVTARMSEIGVAEDLIAVQYTSEPVRIDFNIRYMREILSAATEETCNLNMYDSQSAVVVTMGEVDQYLWVIMPLVAID